MKSRNCFQIGIEEGKTGNHELEDSKKEGITIEKLPEGQWGREAGREKVWGCFNDGNSVRVFQWRHLHPNIPISLSLRSSDGSGNHTNQTDTYQRLLGPNHPEISIYFSDNSSPHKN